MKNHDAKSRPTPSKKITQEEYDRQVAILNEEMELEEMERAMKEKQRRLRKLRLDAQLAGEEDSEAEISSEEEEEETEEKGACGGKPASKRKPKDKNATILELISLPKPSLPEFSGDPLDYHFFINAFESVIGEAQIPDSAKLNRLFDVCKGRAKAAIRSCAAGDPKEGYKKARKILKSRFGDEYVISEAFVSKLTTGPPIKQHEISALQDFLEDIQSCVETLSGMDMLDEIDTRSRMVKIIERLPYAIQTRWRKKATTARRATGA